MVGAPAVGRGILELAERMQFSGQWCWRYLGKRWRAGSGSKYLFWMAERQSTAWINVEIKKRKIHLEGMKERYYTLYIDYALIFTEMLLVVATLRPSAPID